jgi:hypothetical protein
VNSGILLYNLIRFIKLLNSSLIEADCFTGYNYYTFPANINIFNNEESYLLGCDGMWSGKSLAVFGIM